METLTAYMRFRVHASLGGLVEVKKPKKDSGNRILNYAALFSSLQRSWAKLPIQQNWKSFGRMNENKPQETVARYNKKRWMIFVEKEEVVQTLFILISSIWDLAESVKIDLWAVDQVPAGQFIWRSTGIFVAWIQCIFLCVLLIINVNSFP